MIRFLLTGGNGFIGTNMLEALRTGIAEAYTVAVIDIDAPKIPLQAQETWFDTSIMDEVRVFEIFDEIKPDIVIHMAALTSVAPELKPEDYRINTRGSEIIFEACQKYGIDFLVHTSTQFVHQAKAMPGSDTDYAPHTIYGESKVIAEHLLRESRFTFNWCMIRPTNIWGRWHLRYPYEFWKVLKEGKYMHPGKRKVIRSYGYVGNVCWQILEIIKRRNEPGISKNVFYVGDEPVNMYEWTNAFSLAINKKPVTIVPTFVVYLLAATGSLLRKVRIPFPITLSRYESMTTDNPAPMEKTFRVLGRPPYALQEGVKQTTDWLLDFWKKK